jgi:type II secretory pathway pseudopilin PulG
MLLRQTRQSKRAAFTLMEIIAVVTIIMILAGTGVIITTGIISQQRISRAKIDCQTIAKAASIYQTQHGVLPTSIEELTQRQADGTNALLPPEAVLDPWGQHYNYDPGTVHPTTGIPLVFSNGPRDAPQRIQNWAQ